MPSKLDPNLLKDLVSIISPFMEKEDDRRTLLTLALVNTPILQQITYTGSPEAFTVRMVKQLADHGEVRSGELALLALLKEVAAHAGLEKEPLFEELSSRLTKLSSPSVETVIECPYQGLQAFEDEQKDFFFGRQKVIETLQYKLEQAQFVPLIGASGSGKSSVIRAGLIPCLKHKGWQILKLPILPGVEPLAELKRVFSQLFDRTEVGELYSLT
ncbi:MAG: hypothetical protein F6K16_26040 [Symploca sp. SIO2B6]|nr:hypothetical protein [Symploca sp. SIO2B6]